MKILNRLEKLRSSIAEKEIDGIFISQPENRYYLSGFDGSAGFLLITSGEAILGTDFRYIEQAKKQAPDYDIFQLVNDIAEWFPRLLAEVDIKRLGFEAAHLSFATYRSLTDALNKSKAELRLSPFEGLVEDIRAVKEPEEIDLIGKAAAIADSVFEYARGMVEVGMSEQKLAWEIEKFMREKGSQPLPFDIIVASGPNAAMPHAKPSGRSILPGEPIIVDIGAKIDGYASDMTRTFYLGAADKTFSKVYDTVLGAQLTALAMIKEDMSGAEADSLARTVIEEAGYGEAFGHGLGHGVGLATHERPRLGLRSADKLTTGMVFTVEPGIYLPEWGGVRIEDVALMEKGNLRVISKAKKQ